jgi:hypothetical protein
VSGVSATFNEFDLTLFDVGDDSRLNPFEEGEDEKDKLNTMCNHANNLLEVPSRPITRVREKRLKKILNGLVYHTWSNTDLEGQRTPMELKSQHLIYLI